MRREKSEIQVISSLWRKGALEARRAKFKGRRARDQRPSGDYLTG